MGLLRNANPSPAVPDRRSGFSLTAALAKVLIHLDARLFAPAVKPSGLVKGVDECFDFVAGLSRLLNVFANRALWRRTRPVAGLFRRGALSGIIVLCQSDQVESERKVVRDGPGDAGWAGRLRASGKEGEMKWSYFKPGTWGLIESTIPNLQRPL